MTRAAPAMVAALMVATIGCSSRGGGARAEPAREPADDAAASPAPAPRCTTTSNRPRPTIAPTPAP